MNSRGAALPLVLWGIAFLGALVIMATTRINEGMDEESQSGRLFRARQLALQGLAIARHPSIQPGDPLLQKGTPETEGYAVKFSNESGRLNPNFFLARGERAAFTRLFEAWGADPRLADAATDSLADWVDTDEFRSLAGAEAPEYLQDGQRGIPPNAPVRNLQELEMVMHLREVLATKEGWREYFSVLYEGAVNVNEAPPAMLRDLAGLEDVQIERIQEYLAGTDGQRDTEDDRNFKEIADVIAIAGASGPQAEALAKWFGVEGELRRIESTGFCGGLRRTLTAVVSEDGQQILAWEER